MRPNTFGELFSVTTFGESHGPALGVVIDGVPAGLELDLEAVQRDLGRRRPGQSHLTTQRKEPDRVEVLSGLFQGRTTGAPLALVVWNQDARPGAYERFKDLFRPGHADYAVWKKYGVRDWRGGGRLSGRETVARVAAGAVAKQVLARRGTAVGAAVARVAGISGNLNPWRRRMDSDPAGAVELVEAQPIRCPDPEAAERMAQAVSDAARGGDSVGGVVEVRVTGLPAGLGDPVFLKMDALLAMGLMSIGGVKGVEIGDGFRLADLRGSESNDPIGPEGPVTNRAGGVLGGVTTGRPLVARIAVKPTPSISREQQTVDLSGQPAKIRVTGRHDPCLCPRLVVVAEAMAALVVTDALARQAAIEALSPLEGGAP